MNSLFLEYEAMKVKKDHIKVGNYFYWSKTASGVDYFDNSTSSLYDRIFKISNIEYDTFGELMRVSYHYLPNSMDYRSRRIYSKTYVYISEYSDPCPKDTVEKLYGVY